MEQANMRAYALAALGLGPSSSSSEEESESSAAFEEEDEEEMGRAANTEESSRNGIQRDCGRKRDSARRSVSFDKDEHTVVHEIPPYDESIKKELFYSKQDCSQMRFDFEREKDKATMEEQMAAMEDMMNMMKMTTMYLEVPSSSIDVIDDINTPTLEE